MYQSGWRRYIGFCETFNLPPLPLREQSLCQFAAFLSGSVSWGTVRSYLSALRFHQIAAGLPDPSLPSFPRLSYLLKGIHKHSPDHKHVKRQPITPDILTRIHSAWSQGPPTFDKVMLWAAFCLAFFGFMRAGEFTYSPRESPLDGTLLVSDVRVDSRDNPQVVVVFLKTSKTDPFGTGAHLYLGRTGAVLCPVVAVLGYLAIRPKHPGPLFVFEDGTPLSRAHLVTHLHRALSQAGIETANISGHSFRIGAASTAARAGFSDSLIQTLGRWKSSAFTAYIRTPAEDLIAVAPQLARR